MKTNYKELYLLYSADLYNGYTKEDVKRHNAAMKKLGKLFYMLEAEQDRSFLLELLQNEREHTRTLVAAHCLGLGVYVSEAKKVLSDLAKNKDDLVVAYGAKNILEVWEKEGYLKF